MKAIKIDVEKRDVYNIEMGKDYREIYKVIGNNCTMFAVPVTFENMDSLFCDDESLLRNDIKGGFMMPGWVTPIIGNAVIIGTDDEGESVDCLSDLDEIKSKVVFLDLNAILDYRDDALSRGPKIFSF